MAQVTQTTQPTRDEHINLYITTEIRERIRRVAIKRHTNETAAIRFLMVRALEWFEGLPAEQQETL